MRYILIALVITIGLIAFASYNNQKIATNNSSSNSSFIGADIGGPFTLQDQNGETVTDKDYTGQYKLLYFGFTFCPSICPTELQKIFAAYTELSPEQQEQVTPIFISVDPERDTVPVMKDYVELFHPDLVGLTGSVEQIEAVKQEYRIYAAKVKDDSMSDYTVDHSSYIYLMDPNDQLIDIFKIDNTAADILKTLEKHLG